MFINHADWKGVSKGTHGFEGVRGQKLSKSDQTFMFIHKFTWGGGEISKNLFTLFMDTPKHYLVKLSILGRGVKISINDTHGLWMTPRYD